jgi:hypothetical protein
MASKIRDGVIELAHEVDAASNVSSVFPVPGGSFFRLKTASDSTADAIVDLIKTHWPLCSASKSTSDLDGDVTVGVVVPSRGVAWTAALSRSRSGLVPAVCALLSKCALSSVVIVFCWMVLEKLR